MIQVNDVVELENGKLIRVFHIHGDWLVDGYNLGYHKDSVTLHYRPVTPSLKFRQEEVRRCADKWGVKIKFLDKD